MKKNKRGKQKVLPCFIFCDKYDLDRAVKTPVYIKKAKANAPKKIFAVGIK